MALASENDARMRPTIIKTTPNTANEVISARNSRGVQSPQHVLTSPALRGVRGP